MLLNGPFAQVSGAPPPGCWARLPGQRSTRDLTLRRGATAVCSRGTQGRTDAGPSRFDSLTRSPEGGATLPIDLRPEGLRATPPTPGAGEGANVGRTAVTGVTARSAQVVSRARASSRKITAPTKAGESGSGSGGWPVHVWRGRGKITPGFWGRLKAERWPPRERGRRRGEPAPSGPWRAAGVAGTDAWEQREGARSGCSDSHALDSSKRKMLLQPLPRKSLRGEEGA